jgi:glycerophosphoryl diester phosphodiesterase
MAMLRKFQRFISTVAWILFATMLSGCAIPRYTVGLDRLLEQARIDRGDGYNYRCTAGAHRGASEAYVENTLAALKAAEKDAKYAFIEFDVQYSRDGKIVVFHDRRLLRQFGSLRKVGNTVFDELADISGGEIAAYDEVMGFLTKKLNIEIKSQGDAALDASLVDAIVADLRTRKRHKDVLISSISGDVIKYVNQHYPKIPTGQIFWLTSSTYLHFSRLTEKLYADIHATQADYLLLHVANMRNIDDLLRLKPKGKTLVFWDFDDSMYIVHRDLSDRLWGDSRIKSFCQGLRYRVVSLVRRVLPGGK